MTNGEKQNKLIIMKEILKYLKTFKNPTSEPILDYALVKNKTIFVNHIDKILLFDVGRKDKGLIHIDDLIDNFESEIKGNGEYLIGLKTNNYKDYPDLPELDLEEKHLKIVDLEITNEIRYLKNFCLQEEDENRPFTNLIFFDPNNIVATQGHILKVIPHGRKSKFNFVIYKNEFSEIPNGIYDIYVNKNWIFFIDENKTIGIYTEQQEYVPYPKVFPNINRAVLEITLDKKELISICEEHFTLWENIKSIGRPTKQSIIQFNIKGKIKEVIYLSKVDKNSRSTKQEIKSFSGISTLFQISVDIEYLLICLKGILYDKEVTFFFFGQENPILINQTTILMPVKTLDDE